MTKQTPQQLADSITPEQRDALAAIVQPLFDAARRFYSAYAAALKPIARALTEPPTELQLARREMRRVAARERRIAHAHLESTVDAIYADLGLERPTR